jgi:hypothetical protein
MTPLDYELNAGIERDFETKTQERPSWAYSCLSATTGSTREARKAG